MVTIEENQHMTMTQVHYQRYRLPLPPPALEVGSQVSRVLLIYKIRGSTNTAISMTFDVGYIDEQANFPFLRKSNPFSTPAAWGCCSIGIRPLKTGGCAGVFRV